MAKTPNGGDSIFPMYLNLEKVARDEYKLDPTPESIALCDYLNKHLEWNGLADWECYFKPGELFIDGVEVEYIYFSGSATEKEYRYAFWYPYYSKYDQWGTVGFEIYLDDYAGIPKGTMRAYQDD